MRCATNPRGTTFATGSLAAVESSRHTLLRLVGRRARGRILQLVVSEWQLLDDHRSDYAEVGDFQAALTERVRTRVREEKWGFVWWLPLVMMVAEVIIRLLIERWLE